MKKKDCEKLTKMTYCDFEKLDDKKADEMLKKMLPEKGRFKSGAMGDHDWWHAVKYIDVEEKDHIVPMIVIRSWAKYKNRWVYQVMPCARLLYCLHLDNEYMR